MSNASGLSPCSLATFWFGSPPTFWDVAGLNLFALQGHRVKLYSYRSERPRGLDLQIELCDASAILSRDSLFKNRARNTFSGFSNMFRYEMLSKVQVTWIDSDVLPGPHELETKPYMMGWESESSVNGAILRLPSDSKVLSLLLSRSREISDSKFTWGALGPKLITSTVYELDLVEKVQPQGLYYPISAAEVWKLFQPRFRGWAEETTAGSQAIHLWNEVFRSAGEKLKSYLPPKGSFLGNRFSQLESFERDAPRMHPWKIEVAMRVRGPAKRRILRLIGA